MYKFEKLIVWDKSVELAKRVYLFSEELRDFGLKDQLRRAATSIPINIAEGSGSQNDKEFKRYLYISRKSLFETMACLRIIEYIHSKKDKHMEERINEVGKLLNGLINKVKSDNESNR